MNLKLPAVNPRHAANVAGLCLVGGAATTAVYQLLELSCPMTLVGLACPGCGCGRAAISFVFDGPAAAIRQQPTALFLLLSLVLLATVGRLSWFSWGKWRSNFVVAVPIHLAFVNLVFQLNRAGAI